MRHHRGPCHPTNVVADIPITLTNTNTLVLPGTPLAIGVSLPSGTLTGFNAAAYQQYETCNLNNGEFFFANGTVINSWLEGNLINENTYNAICTSAASHNALVDSTNVLYWVEYGWPASFLPSNTGIAPTNTIYLGWLGNVISASNTVFSGSGATGERARSCQARAPTPSTTTGRGYSRCTRISPARHRRRQDGRSRARA